MTEEEERHLEAHLEQALQLPPVDRTRLRAHLQWLLVEPPKLTGMKSRLRVLTPSHRALIGRFVVSVAGADGTVSRDEVNVLSRVYTLIGLEPEQLHSDIHALASSPAAHPVTVLPNDESVGHRIPPPIEAATTSTDTSVPLDTRRIAEVMTHLLAEIFEEPTEQEVQ